MATNSTWTVIFEDKLIINQTVKNEGNHSVGYKIDDDAFWNQSKFSNVWAIQYKDDDLDYNDTVEYRDDTPHTTWNEANLGNFQDFITKWDSAHLSQLQTDWDNNNELVADSSGSIDDGQGNMYREETEAEKITRIGARPTAYSS